MTKRRAGDSHRRHFWRIGRLVCGVGAAIGLFVGVSAIASAQPPETNNPPLTAKCGLKVMLSLDESQSISSAGFNAVAPVRLAANGFVTALEDTGSPVGVSAWHSWGRPGPPETTNPGVGYTAVTPANLSMFTDWIGTGSGAPTTSGGYFPQTTVSTSNTSPNPRQTTNWQDAFNQVSRTPGGPPNLVVFVTDGNPNTVGSGGSPPNSNTTPGTAAGTGRPFFINDLNGPGQGRDQARDRAVPIADALKGQGVRIFGIGVGPDVQDPTSAGRLAAVTGPTEGTNPITADYALVANFADLRAELVRIVADLCGSRLIINKRVANVHGGPWMPGQGWDFTADLTSPGHTWLQPSSAGNHDHATLTSDSNGRLEFLWKLSAADTTANLGVTKETVKPGFHFVEARCETHNLAGDLLDETVSTTLPIPRATLGPEEYRTCYVYNSPPAPGNGGGDEPDVVHPADAPHLTVHKTMPAHAHVGDRVPITITVKNTGKGTAKDVVLHENRPGGLQIVHVANHGSLQHDGTAVWHLGNLAPGESRTVHATALVTHTGLHPDTAVASASNADPAFSNAAVRAATAHHPSPSRPSPSRPAPVRRPPFTG